MRRNFFKVALVAGLFIVGGLFGILARMCIGGFNEQFAQLDRSILASQHSHPNEDARSTMSHLDVEVPECMEEAGYEKALDNENCSTALWEGNVYCYVPKSLVGKLIYRIETFSGGNT